MSEFERCRPYLEAALEYSGGTHTIDDVKYALDAQRMLLVPGERCAMVFEKTVYPRLSAFHGFLAGGDLEEIKSFDPKLDILARALGCSRIDISGRQGWARALRSLNYEPRWLTVSKGL